MPEFSFAEPQWVHLIWGVLGLVALLAWLERRGSDALDRFVSVALRGRLVRAPGAGQRAARLVFLALTGIFACLALMRPQWGEALVESRRAGAEIMVCLDVSRSMLAEDAAPNRLERAKVEIADLLELLDGDQVGLIAFAGRASVISPLTPDFGFLRLALDDAGPNSVGRGGTRLEEPIRKALAGFGAGFGAGSGAGSGGDGEVSRSILLITDGEDHDSFPMEAARAAAERGIKILAIGFGAEAGSEIPLTDPNTGARTVVRDSQGAVVRSRLDGDLLREMALVTGGAYIPAGTGQLDLESIYLRHIAPLTRGQLDGGSRTVRKDAFQWAVLLALLTLVGAVWSSARIGRAKHRPIDDVSGGAQHSSTSGLGLPVVLLAIAVCGVALVALAPLQVRAQISTSEGEPGVTVGDDESAREANDDEVSDPVPEDPREAYNLGLALLQTGDPTAVRYFEAARTGAGTDGETRFRATYNLGWAEVKAADSVLSDQPREALNHLQRAAAWFRDAIDLRPADENARYNLEVVLRRSLELADSLAAAQQDDLRQVVDQLLEAQRAMLASLREGVVMQQGAVAQGASAGPNPGLRKFFRGLATRQLGVLADAQGATEQAARELEALRQPAAGASGSGGGGQGGDPQDATRALRAARLDAVIAHLHQSRQRMGQSRSRLRRVQGERAYRRSAAALEALHRARDQLLSPVARLDALLADGTELARLTALKAQFDQNQGRVASDPPRETTQSASNAGSASARPDDPARPVPRTLPAWLSPRYLHQAQQALVSRTEELASAFSAAAQSAGGPASDNQAGGAGPSPPATQPDPQAAQLQRAVVKAAPLVERASNQFQSAAGAVESQHLHRATSFQRNALEALAEAREMFLDLRRLVELVYQQERQVDELLDSALAPGPGRPGQSGVTGPPDEEAIAAQLFLGSALHRRNIERALRLNEMFTDAMAQQSAEGGGGDAGAPAASADPAGPAGGDRLQQGYDLLGLALEQMHIASRHLEEVDANGEELSPAEASANAAQPAIDASLVHLEDLRRLFFSLLEHLEDAALRHQTLADETEVLTGLAESAPSARGAAGDGAGSTVTREDNPPKGSEMEVEAKPDAKPGVGDLTARAGPLGNRQRALAENRARDRRSAKGAGGGRPAQFRACRKYQFSRFGHPSRWCLQWRAGRSGGPNGPCRGAGRRSK